MITIKNIVTILLDHLLSKHQILFLLNIEKNILKKSLSISEQTPSQK